MQIHNLPGLVRRSKKRVGRGMGSGKGSHTVGRGQKGQKTRGKIPLTFEGTKIKKSLLKRLPVLRGKGKFKTLKTKAITVNLHLLNNVPSGSKVDLDFLKKNKIVSLHTKQVKIVDGDDFKNKLTISLPISSGARARIEKAGGEVV